MSDKDGPTLRAQWLGQQLRELREGKKITLKQAADYLERDPSTVSRFESAEYPIRRADLLALLDYYSVSDKRRRDALLTLREEVWQKGWWDGYADDVDRRFIDYVWLESRAREIFTFDDTLLPGLLQTQGYARAAIEGAESAAVAEQVDRWVELRMNRQRILTSEHPPRLRSIVDESLLHRMVGGVEVMREQMLHLRECLDRDGIDIRVLPFAAGAHASPAGAFKLFKLVEPYPEIAYVETLAGSLYVETPSVARFFQTYDRLSGAVLGPAESAELISARAEELR